MKYTFDADLTSPYSNNFILSRDNLDSVITYDGTYTDETSDASNDTTNDFNITSWDGSDASVDDAIYFGSDNKFDELVIELSTSASTSVWTWTMEYYNGITWEELPVTDDSTTFTEAAGVYHIYWNKPKGWSKNTVNNVTYFFVRYRISSYTSATAQPKGRIVGIINNKSDLDVTIDIRFDTTSNCICDVYKLSQSGRDYDVLLDSTTLSLNSSYIYTNYVSKFRDHIRIDLTYTTGNAYGIITTEFK